MSDKSNFNSTVESLFNGMSDVVTSNSVVGEAIHMGDTIILPLVDISFGMGAGAFADNTKGKGTGGIGGKMTPCACLVLHNGNTKLVNIKNQDSIVKLLDLIPDVVDKVAAKFGKVKENSEVDVDEVIKEATDENKKSE